MKKLILTGIIKQQYRDGWHAIYLRQSDGYLIDLIGRFIELDANSNSTIQVNYFISDFELSEIQIKEAIISKLSGSVNAEYEKHDFSYSEWTHDTSYSEILQIGSHDISLELKLNLGKFVRFEINYTPFN